jgi:hypothetical protein
MYLAARPPVNISDYRGDGSIARLKHPINPGFQIDFAPFSMASPVAVTYRLDGLPKPRHHSDYRVGLVPDLSETEVSSRWPHVPAWLTTGSVGSLTIEVLDVSGGIALACQSEVAALYWHRVAGVVPLGEIRSDSPACDTGRLSSSRKAGERLALLKVSYTPGPGPPNRQAHISVAAGGFD